MTKTVLVARLQAAGLDPTLFTEYDLRRIKAFYAADDIPFPPALPSLPIKPPPTVLITPTLDAIADVAERCLDALQRYGLMLAFSGQEMRAALSEICIGISRALPGWMRAIEDYADAVHDDCTALGRALDRAETELRRAACLHAAAILRDPATAMPYFAAVLAMETLIHAAERHLAEADESLTRAEHLLNRDLPTLIDSILPFVDGSRDSLSQTDCRNAAIALRNAAKFR